MNAHAHRLVFSRLLGMLVPAAEHAHARGGSGSSARRLRRAPRWLAAALLASAFAPAMAQGRPPVVFASRLAAPVAPLPVPYSATNVTPRPFAFDPAKGGNSSDLSKSGRVAWNVDGKRAVFDQGSVERVVVNWESFNIAPGYTVHFAQDKDPAKYVSALNRIWGADPSIVLGSLTADREVILVNTNGVYFGRGARVDTGKFIASTLSIADAVFEQGLRNIRDGSAVFTTAGADHRATQLDGAVTVEPGAEIRSAAGGDVMLIAPRVVNQGRIETPGGQSILVAGERVYLMSSADPKQRGLIVAVDPVRLAASGLADASLGSVENSASGSYKTVAGATVPDATADATAGLVHKLNEIRADSGTVNLVGLSVRQQGVINATTAVKGANGAVYLQAMASTTPLPGGSGATSEAAQRGLTVEAGGVARAGLDLGTVQLGPASVTAVRPSDAARTQIDAEVFNPSLVRVEGAAIAVDGGARIEAPSGRIELLAAANTFRRPAFDSSVTELPAAADGSRVVIGTGATLSTAGLSGVVVDGSRNQGSQRLFRIELADAPVQRSGPLYRTEVFFDRRDAAAIKVADVSGSANAIGRSAQERSTTGGTIRVESEGDLVVAAGAVLDVSGGSVQYAAAPIRQTLVTQDGRTVLFGKADASSVTEAVATTTQTVQSPAYVEGKDGGTLSLNARRAVVDGSVRGSVVEGAYQRDGRSRRATPSTMTVGRQMGNRFYLDSLSLRAAGVEPLPDAILEQPLSAALDDLPASTRLSLDPVQRGGFGRLSLRATRVQDQGPVRLDLGPGGSLDITAGSIALDGRFTAAGGSIALTTLLTTDQAGAPSSGDVDLSATSVLDAAGLWTNDTVAAKGAAAPVRTDGGTLTLRAARSLRAEGSVFDVSAGAHLSAAGSLKKGKAGALSLIGGSAFPGVPAFSLALDGATLRGFDFAQGGSLRLDAPELTIGDNTAGGFALQTGFFSQGGFGSFTLNSASDVRLSAGTTLAPTQRTWALGAGYRAAPSGPMSLQVAQAAVPDPALVERQPLKLSLAAMGDAGQGHGQMVLERDSKIALEHGSTLTLRANGSVQVGASGGTVGGLSRIDVPGGKIQIAIDGVRGGPQGPSDDPIGFDPGQALWLGAGARLSVDGVATLRRDTGASSTYFHPGAATPDGPRWVGSVLGGGSIELNAARGYVVLQPGSDLSLDGALAAISRPGSAAPETVARSAGSLSISSPEGFVLEGTVSAKAPLDASGRPGADGGRLNLALGRGGVRSATLGTPYPVDDNGNALPRLLSVGGSTTLSAAAKPGASIDDWLGNGIGHVPAPLLQEAGFERLKLSAGDRLHFERALALSQPLGIEIEAPMITAAPGARVDLRSGARIALGDLSSRVSGASALAAPAASQDPGTSLRLAAPLIDVSNQSGFGGFARVDLQAGARCQPGACSADELALERQLFQGRRDGEIRLTSARDTDAQVGLLNFSGTLALTAGQIFVSSGAAFTLQGNPALLAGDPGSALLIQAPVGGSTSLAPLSAFGQLVASASRIEQAGVLRQPFGSIELQATERLTLAQGGLTSVSGEGVVVPYGETENLSRWLVRGQPVTALPVDKRVSLRAPQIVSEPGARVSASGGGEVQASEFFPGVGGSKDIFDTAGLYALLPDRAAMGALTAAGALPTDGSLGREIVISLSVPGLPAGRYTLLPARYALLGGSLPQGAFLVSRAGDQGKTALAAPIRQDDGSHVVTGYLTETGSVAQGLSGERFVVEPLATFMARSEVRTTGVSALLAGRAQALGEPAPAALPDDGGRIEIRASGSGGGLFVAGLDLRGNGARAGQLDVAASRLALVGEAGQAAPGALSVLASSIADSGAGSVLIGGLRQRAAGADTRAMPAWSIDATGTESVTVDLGGRSLAVEELLLAATGSVSLADSTVVRAAGAARGEVRNLQLSGDGALLAVSASPVAAQRSGTSLAQGTLRLGAGSVLAGAQVLLDATGATTIGDGVELSADALSIAAPRLGVGSALTPVAGALVLDGALLDSTRQARALTLRSYSSIDFAGAQDWAARPAGSLSDPARVLGSLTLDAPQVRSVSGVGAQGQAVAGSIDIAAAAVTLTNTSGRSLAQQEAGTGTLRLQALARPDSTSAAVVQVGPGSQVLAATDSRLQSGSDIVLQGGGKLSAQGDLRLDSARMTAASGADAEVRADAGLLRVARTDGAASAGTAQGSGASVRLAARQVQQQGRIELASGRLQVSASGDGSDAPSVEFAAGSSTVLAGAVRSAADGTQAHARGGDLSIQATQGRVELLGTVDVSAARLNDGQRVGDAGSVSIAATGPAGALVLSRAAAADTPAQAGQLIGHGGAAPGDRGGSLGVDLQQAGSMDTIAAQSVQGGFNAAVSARARQGDLTLRQDLQAARVRLSADAGTLTLAAAIDARAPTGGVVALAAGQDLVLAGGASINARSTRADAGGGDVLLASSQGSVRVLPNATVEAGGDSAGDGRIVLRAQRQGTTGVAVAPLDTRALRAGEVDIEAVRVYSSVTAGANTRAIAAIGGGTSTVSGNQGVLGQTSVRTDSSNYMAGASTILDGLGVATAERSRVLLRAGVEVRAAGDLAITADWGLQADRPGGDAGMLTVRAAGNLNLNNSISDGFSSAISSGTINANPRSWSYRLVGGADQGAADPMAVLDLSGASAGAGDVRLAAGKLVRTGAGSIELAAGRDLVYAAGSGSTPTGSIYVAGRAHAGLSALTTGSGVFARQSAKPVFTEAGGRVDLMAGRDLVAPEATQLVGNWFWRSGLTSTLANEPGLYASTSHLGWWSQFTRFNQSVASFGGGDLRVQAGRDVRNLQAMVPSAAWADSRDRASANLVILDGGDLDVRAGRDLLGGQFFVARGIGRVDAGRGIGLAAGNGVLQAPVFAQMDADWRLQARSGVVTHGSFNPTLVPGPTADSRYNTSGLHATFGSASSWSVQAAAGDIEWRGYAATTSLYGVQTSEGAPLYRITAPIVRLSALDGGLRVFSAADNGAAVLFPSAAGHLSWWAQGDIALGGSVAMADNPIESWPSWREPARAPAGSTGLRTPQLVGEVLDNTAARVGLQSASPEPVAIHAGGDFATEGLAALQLSKAARIAAGGDVGNLRLNGQNLSARDLTQVTAGANFLAGQTGFLNLGGPGDLVVTAGRQVDLDASGGLVTIGNQRNAALPAQGASIMLRAAAAGTLDVQAFEAAFLSPGSSLGSTRDGLNRDALLSWVRARLNRPGLDYAQAWTLFQGLPAEDQAVFGRQVLADEFGARYLAGAVPAAAAMTESLRQAFETRKAQLLLAGAAALAAGQPITLPGREVLQGAALASYLDEIRALGFASLDLDAAVSQRLGTLGRIRSGWRDTVAASLGSDAAALDALAAAQPQDARALAWQAALLDFRGERFERYRDRALAQELASAGAAASQFGRKSLPMRLALFDQGFLAAELAAAGSFVAQPIWPGAQPVFRYAGALDMTQSSVVTERGGDIALINPGGAINVGLKQSTSGTNAPKGVIALGGGAIVGYARDDFQVNVQRVFVVGQGDMTVWSSSGDIDSGRGANTAVAAPPLMARRSADGVVFEVPATTTGSGLGILEDGQGRRQGSIGLFPAFGEILALDAFIRAPSVVLGSAVQGADNLQAAAVGGAAAPVSAPVIAAPPAPAPTQSRAAEPQAAGPAQEARQRNSLLTVDLLGVGPADPEAACAEGSTSANCQATR